MRNSLDNIERRLSNVAHSNANTFQVSTILGAFDAALKAGHSDLNSNGAKFKRLRRRCLGRLNTPTWHSETKFKNLSSLWTDGEHPIPRTAARRLSAAARPPPGLVTDAPPTRQMKHSLAARRPTNHGPVVLSETKFIPARL